jgi:uncharacterized protein
VEVTLYLDASVLVALFSDDAHTERTDLFFREHPTPVAVSDFAAAEFASAIARKVRERSVDKPAARGVFRSFDEWLDTRALRLECTSADILAAASLIRRLDLSLRTPDALHLAIARRAGVGLATLDEQMAATARALGFTVAPL